MTAGALPHTRKRASGEGTRRKGREKDREAFTGSDVRWVVTGSSVTSCERPSGNPFSFHWLAAMEGHLLHVTSVRGGHRRAGGLRL